MGGRKVGTYRSHDGDLSDTTAEASDQASSHFASAKVCTSANDGFLGKKQNAALEKALHHLGLPSRPETLDATLLVDVAERLHGALVSVRAHVGLPHLKRQTDGGGLNALRRKTSARLGRGVWPRRIGSRSREKIGTQGSSETTYLENTSRDDILGVGGLGGRHFS